MKLARRTLLATPLLLAAEPAPPAAPVAVTRADGRVALTWVGRGAVVLPGPVRLLGTLRLARVALAAVEVPADAGLSLLALCGMPRDGARPLLLGLEVLRWRGAAGTPAQGAHLETHFAVVTDLRRIRLERKAAMPRDRVHWRRAEWTDYLAWQPPRLVDAPVRSPLPGTWQAALGALRVASLDWLATPRDSLSAADLAALGLRGGRLLS